MQFSDQSTHVIIPHAFPCVNPFPIPYPTFALPPPCARWCVNNKNKNSMTEIAIIGSDVQEVVGSAIAIQLLFGLPLWAGVLITAADTFTMLFLHYFGIRKLEAFFAVLIATMAVCFFIQFGIASPPPGPMFEGLFVPTIPRSTAVQAAGMLGAVIMPHNIYLHSALVQSRKVNHNSEPKVREAVRYFTLEACISLFVSFLINFSVVCVFAVGFFRNPQYEDVSIGLSKAGSALEGAFGKSAKYLWAVGLLAAGQSSTMTGTFAGQHVMIGFLDLKVAPWVRTLLTRSIALIPSMTVALLFTKDLDVLNEWLNVLQSVQLPFALVPLLKFTGSAMVMGAAFRTRAYNTVGWILAVLVLAVNGYLISVFADQTLPRSAGTWVVLGLLGTGYYIAVAVLAWRPVVNPQEVLNSNPDELGTV
eukprot:TRINITY_DN8424_c0_g1_i1.p1 TRINITY_DN8424_c0_g1~~TRINITY_DN8424_c0_g1_i1.p1  ORF type:complete len:419 (+),score=45.21 TRINITY_DN8424_c0_g1_i1:667-1923(+)